jgi:hypothetical protein
MFLTKVSKWLEEVFPRIRPRIRKTPTPSEWAESYGKLAEVWICKGKYRQDKSTPIRIKHWRFEYYECTARS